MHADGGIERPWRLPYDGSCPLKETKEAGRTSLPCILKAMQERLQKYLSRCGVASRRRAEVLIAQGKVAVNGQAATVLGTKIDPARDTVTLDGKTVSPPAALTYVALHKPAGYLTTRGDPYRRRTVYDLLPQDCRRLKPVGRLDSASEGLLFLSDDGAWAHRVAHPRHGGEKEYAVLVNGTLTNEQCASFRGPMTLDGYLLHAVTVHVREREGENTWVSMTLTEGRKRQIRQMLAALGKHAIRLIRIRIGPVLLGNLQPGRVRSLSQAEIDHWRGDRESAPAKGRESPSGRLPRRQAMSTATESAAVDPPCSATRPGHRAVSATRPSLTVAIDGAAGSGKSALGSLLAARLGYLFVDTGAFYRALTLAALRARVSLADGTALAALARTLDIRIEPPTVADGRQFTLLLDDEDVTWEVRSPAVDAGVSPVAAQPEARAALLPVQQKLARQKGVVMAGRDIGTVVCPDADVKVFLAADLETRAQRRRQELADRGTEVSADDVAKSLADRDRIDSSRATAPLAQPPDAMALDTSRLTLEQEVAAVLARVETVQDALPAT